MTIAILAPYGNHETTYAALRLADLAVAQGQDIRLIATVLHGRHVSPFWDRRIVTDKNDNMLAALHGARVVIHFECSRGWLAQADLVAGEARNILVPSWQRLFVEDSTALPYYARVVCPSKTCCDRLKKSFSLEEAERITWCRWDAGTVPRQRDGTYTDKRVKACFVCGSRRCRDTELPAFIDVLADLLHLVPYLDITVFAASSWPRRVRQGIRDLNRLYGKRFTWIRQDGWSSHMTQYNTHDWVVFTDTGADFAFLPSMALSAGAAVIAFDVEPFSEVVCHRHNGLLVPCDTEEGLASRAVFAAAPLLRTCKEAFSDPYQLFALQQRDWHMAHLRETFDNAWTNFWADG